jgi:HPt (histidine-containing phosphotransfer) domain-containing protein
MSMTPSLDGMFKLLAMLPVPTRHDMVRMYCEALEVQVALLGQSLAQGPAQATMAAAHKIAGSAAMMQDQALSRAARAFEAALREGRTGEALGHWPSIQHCARLTLECLRAAYPDRPGAATSL